MKLSMKPFFPSFRQSILLSVFVLFSVSELTAKQLDQVTYTKEQSRTAIEIIRKLDRHHYINLSLNDNLSSRLLDNYLDRLDSGRTYFLQEDLKEFEKYRLTLDDTLNSGNLEPGFLIFNRYQQRVIARLENTLENLPELVANLDFKRDESLDISREDSQWPTTQKESDDLWRKLLKSRVLSLRLAKKPTEEIVPLLQKRFENQLNRIKQSNSEDAFQVYMNSLTSLYDPHTTYLSPTASENFNINMSLSLEGIGAVLQTEDEYTKVVRLVHAGPADKQGQLQPSDKIVGVAQGDKEMQDVIGLRLDEVVQLIRGPKGSIVRLEVIPVLAKTDSDRVVINITRDKVKLEEQSAQKKVLDVFSNDQLFKIGIIDIPAFYVDFAAMRRGDPNYKSTTRDVSRLLAELEQEGVDGIIIDLRENGGGSLQEANMLTGLFIESGPTVQIRHSNTQVFRDGKRRSSKYYQGPLAVVINRLSASASEIFAGAIQDYNRGIVVGSQSFGKGTVQQLVTLLQGQLKITESKFYRISGDSTQHRGIVPDILFPSLYDFEKVGESSLDNALAWDRINPIRHQRYKGVLNILPELKNKHVKRIKDDPDFIYLKDQLALSEENKKITTLPLNEQARIEFNNTEKERSLAIENKRRLAKGLDPIKDFDDETEESATEDNSEPESADAENQSSLAEDDTSEDTIDAILTETGNILVDSILLTIKNNKGLPKEKVAYTN